MISSYPTRRTPSFVAALLNKVSSVGGRAATMASLSCSCLLARLRSASIAAFVMRGPSELSKLMSAVKASAARMTTLACWNPAASWLRALVASVFEARFSDLSKATGTGTASAAMTAL